MRLRPGRVRGASPRTAGGASSAPTDLLAGEEGAHCPSPSTPRALSPRISALWVLVLSPPLLTPFSGYDMVYYAQVVTVDERGEWVCSIACEIIVR